MPALGDLESSMNPFPDESLSDGYEGFCGKVENGPMIIHQYIKAGRVHSHPTSKTDLKARWQWWQPCRPLISGIGRQREAGRYLSPRPALSTEQVPGQPS